MYLYCDFSKLICFGLLSGANGPDYGFHFKLHFGMHVFYSSSLTLAMVHEGENLLTNGKMQDQVHKFPIEMEGGMTWEDVLFVHCVTKHTG